VGKKKEKITQEIVVVLNTNIVVSAILFKGKVSTLMALWHNGTIKPVMTKEIFDEIHAVLKYPKFMLTKHEIDYILNEELLLFFDVITDNYPNISVCKDEDDDKFIRCALSAKAKYIITGDKELLQIKKYKDIEIMSCNQFLNLFKK